MDGFSDIESSSSDVGSEVNEVETPDADFGDGDGVNDFDDTYESMNNGDETMEYSQETPENQEPVENNNENTETAVDEQLNDFDDIDESAETTETPDVAPAGDNVEQTPSDMTTDENVDDALSDFEDDDESGEADTESTADETGESDTETTADETGEADTESATDETGESDTESTTDETGEADTESTTDETGEADTESTTDETGEGDTESATDETGESDTETTADETGESDTETTTDETGESDTESTTDGTGEADTESTTDETGESDAKSTTDETDAADTEDTADETDEADTESTADETDEAETEGTADETDEADTESTADETDEADTEDTADETDETDTEDTADETDEADTEDTADETDEADTEDTADETDEADAEDTADETDEADTEGTADEAETEDTADETDEADTEDTADETDEADTADETDEAVTEDTADETSGTDTDGTVDGGDETSTDDAEDASDEANDSVIDDQNGDTEASRIDGSVDGNNDGTDSNSDAERDHTEKNAVFENVSYHQGQNDLGALGTCGPTSIANSLNRVTGSTEYTENKVLHNAMDNNLCHKSDNPYSCGGTTTRDVVNIIDNVKNPDDNIHTEVYEYDKALSVEDLANRLDDPGTVAMVGVDSATLWDQRGDVACSGLFQHTDSPSDHWITVDSPIRDEAGNLTGFIVIDSGGGVSEVSREKFEAMYIGDASHTVSDPTAVIISNNGDVGSTYTAPEGLERTSNYKGSAEVSDGNDPPNVTEIHSYTAEEISKEFGTEISQDYIDQNKQLYERYYELKDAGLGPTEIRNQMLSDGLEKFKKSHDSDTTPETLKSTMENAYTNTLKYDNCVSRNTYMDIKNGLVPYNPAEQFPNAYSIWQDKFTNQDVGALVSDDTHNRIVGNYTGIYETRNFNAWGRPADMEHPNGDIYVMNYDDAVSVLDSSASIQEVADTVGIDVSWYDTNWTTSEPSDSVWVGKINADEVSGLRTSSPNDLSANEFWAPGMQTANPNGGEGKFEAVINRIEDIKTSHASFSEKTF